MIRLVGVVASGCVAGGGPYVAYGQHGWSAGAEIGAGVTVAEADVGLDVRADRSSVYVRADVVPLVNDGLFDDLVPISASVGPALRLGAGWSFADVGGAFALGAGGSTYLARPAGCSAELFRLNDLSVVGTLELQLRYIGGWSLALAPRLDGRAIHCEST